MDSLIATVAQFLPYLILVAAGFVWLFVPRRDKVGLAVQGVLALLVVTALIHLAGAIHADPRPFVVDSSVKPLFAHAGDNGFPSDHTAVAATVALLVMTYRRSVGGVLLVLSIIAGAARVAAHVHHAQDIVAGVFIAALAVGVAAATWRWARQRLPRRVAEPASV